MTSQFDISTARKHFPALNQDQVFFDNAGGSQTLGTVIDSISTYLSKNNVQLGASYDVGKASTERYNKGIGAAAKYINAERDEVVFGSSTTQLLRNLSHAIDFRPGDEIIVSKMDHEANIAPWISIASRLSLTVKWWTPEIRVESLPSSSKKTTCVTPELTPESLSPLLTSKTRLVAFTHVSNVLGTINDVPQLSRHIHENCPRALVVIDGVAYAPHRPIDVYSLGADFYVFSWYKVYGPHVAMMYGSRQAQKSLIGLGHYFSPSETLEQKLGLAGASYELVQSVPAAVEYLSGCSEVIVEQECRLQQVLLEYLMSRPSEFTIYGTPDRREDQRVPTVSFTVEGWSSRKVVESVENVSPFGFRCGHFYSKRLVDEVLGLGDEGVVRVSMLHYNTGKKARPL
ncbi:PLP-dependent transferase [Saccharata proteae CBS 121410]|uniref:PLP-dependent transferase n=1 Tax=Saccharata proteae CBS 121410 TaxID=1314787 RepID=A0A6A5YEH2_9PEZI|nr:PLP-dependent transferase [Saccharata proteae CBS 121410]